MAFELKADKSVVKGVNRILRKQIEGSLEALHSPDTSDPDETVHAVRKRFKRIRAVLRLLRGAIPEKDYRRENLRFRDAARPLTTVRDAVVLVETFGELPAEGKSVPRKVRDQVRRELRRRRDALRKQVLEEEESFPKIAEAVEPALDRTDDLPVQEKGWAALETGLARVYDAGRQAFDEALAEPTVANLHEWRKQAKYLWHQLQILRPCAPEFMDELTRHAHALGDLLGDDHDLAVLRGVLSDQMDPPLDPDALAGLLEWIDSKRDELQQQATPLGQQLYHERPRAFVWRIGRHFRAWRAERRSAVAAGS